VAASKKRRVGFDGFTGCAATLMHARPLSDLKRGVTVPDEEMVPLFREGASMRWRTALITAIRSLALPALALVIYFLIASLLPWQYYHLFFWESGVVENATAAAFLTAGVAAAVLAIRSRAAVPAPYRCLYILFGLVFLWAGLEELSYGQHLFGWTTPEWLGQHNHQGETNLHNVLEDGKSRRLHRWAAMAYPAVCLVPLLFLMGRGSFRPGHWTYYLLPRWELVPWMLCEQTVRLLGKGLGGQWPGVLGEFRECYWALTALVYIVVLWRRVGKAPPAAASPEAAMAPLRKAG
jgi:hypothetical protein